MDEILSVNGIPKLPGCYIFRNRRREIIYIGKSKSLYNRVGQYFRPTKPTEYSKYAEMAKEVREIETIVTATETDALIMECRLIKKHKPKYNSALKKSNTYPYICIDMAQAFPAITIADNVQDDGRNYHGSFYDRYDAQSAIELIGGIWQTPTCKRDNYTGGSKPCLNHYIGRCCAPCAGIIDRGSYRQKIMEVLKCLNGNYKPTLRRLNSEMESAAKTLEFEKAGRIRDSIQGLNRLKRKQKRLYTDLGNKDVYLFFRAFNEQCFSLFFIKNGVTLNRLDFPDINEPEDEYLMTFIRDNRQGNISIEEGTFLTTCLLDIAASKLFLPVPQTSSLLQTLKILRKAYIEFIYD